MGHWVIEHQSVSYPFSSFHAIGLMIVIIQEQFTERWNYKDWNTPGPNYVAGNYGAATNVWQVGLCMALCMY